MQTVLLAAGPGPRLTPLTEPGPPSLLPVVDRPLIAHAADAAIEGGASELIVVVGNEVNRVRTFFGHEYRTVPVTYARQAAHRGAADALRAARPYLEEDFVVIEGDTLFGTGLTALYENSPAVAVTTVQNPSDYGVVMTDGGTVQRILEQPANPPTSLVNAGAYAFPAAATELFSVGRTAPGEYGLADVVDRVTESFDLDVIELEDWLKVRWPWDLLRANERKLTGLENEIRGEVASDASLRGPVVVDDGATIEHGVLIEGPVLVEAGAHVGPNACIRGKSVLGRNTHVGNGAEVTNSLLFPGSSVSQLASVGDSILGRDVEVGAGTVVANHRHDGDPVYVSVNGERISTGRRKFGVVAGSGVKTGVDTSIEPGVVLSRGATTTPGERVSASR